jgi:hypothetical protein
MLSDLARPLRPSAARDHRLPDQRHSIRTPSHPMPAGDPLSVRQACAIGVEYRLPTPSAARFRFDRWIYSFYNWIADKKLAGAGWQVSRFVRISRRARWAQGDFPVRHPANPILGSELMPLLIATLPSRPRCWACFSDSPVGRNWAFWHLSDCSCSASACPTWLDRSASPSSSSSAGWPGSRTKSTTRPTPCPNPIRNHRYPPTLRNLTHKATRPARPRRPRIRLRPSSPNVTPARAGRGACGESVWDRLSSRSIRRDAVKKTDGKVGPT